jgi:hypothetical protein
MNRYIMIRRLRGPAFLLLVGVDALLAQAHILGWGKTWPFFLILAGVFALAERAAISAEDGYPPYPGMADPNAPMGGQPATAPPSSAIVPAPTHDFGKNPDGGQS